MVFSNVNEITENDLVFGLDIGTRSIVGTVGYKEGDKFIVVAQKVKEHETRAMLDGQIHDIGRVGATIAQVRAELEAAVGCPLTDVCIAAAGRVLRTVTTHAEQVFETEREVATETTAAKMKWSSASKAPIHKSGPWYAPIEPMLQSGEFRVEGETLPFDPGHPEGRCRPEVR